MSLYVSMLTDEMLDVSLSSRDKSRCSTGASSRRSSYRCVAIAQVLEIALEVVGEVYNNIEAGMECATIQWRGKRMIVEDLSEDDAVFHFWFRKNQL